MQHEPGDRCGGRRDVLLQTLVVTYAPAVKLIEVMSIVLVPLM